MLLGFIHNLLRYQFDVKLNIITNKPYNQSFMCLVTKGHARVVCNVWAGQMIVQAKDFMNISLIGIR